MAHSVLSSPNPVTAAIQIILGRSTSLDVCSINSNNQLSIFCACGLNYGISNLHLIPKAEDMSWFNEKISTFGRKLSNRFVRFLNSKTIHMLSSSILHGLLVCSLNIYIRTHVRVCDVSVRVSGFVLCL